MSRRRKAWYSFFFLLLWVQLIFAIGLMIWRYQLIILRDGDVYLGNTSPGLNGFIGFVDKNCPEGLAMGYLSDLYKSGEYARYDLYPRFVQPLPNAWRPPALFNSGKILIPGAPDESPPGGCLMIEYMEQRLVLAGKWLDYNANQALIVFQ